MRMLGIPSLDTGTCGLAFDPWRIRSDFVQFSGTRTDARIRYWADLSRPSLSPAQLLQLFFDSALDSLQIAIQSHQLLRR